MDPGSPASFGTDALGNLYQIDYRGRLLRVEPQTTSTDMGDVLDGGGGDDVIYAGGGDDSLAGGACDDTFHGMNGNDNLDGGEGSDRMLGGNGDDQYVFTAGDIVVEGKNGGNDTIRTKVSFTLTDRMAIETLWTSNTSGTANLDLTGNRFDNAISGHAGENHIRGLSGVDVLKGLLGNDILEGGAGADLIRACDGDDRPTGAPGTTSWMATALRPHDRRHRRRPVHLARHNRHDTDPNRAEPLTDFDGASGDRIDISHIDATKPCSGSQPFASSASAV